MRVRIIFKLRNKGAVLPFHHQRNVTLFLLEVLGADYDLNQQMICFSGLKGQTKISREGLGYFSRRVTLVLSSLNDQLIDLFIERLFARNQVMLGNLILEPEYVEEEIPAAFGNETRFLCISPLVLLNTDDNFSNKHFWDPSTSEFSDFLYESLMHRMEASGLYSAEEISSFYKFQFVPDLTYLERIRQQDKKFARIYTLVYDGNLREVRGYTLPFKLLANPSVQSFAFFNGLGELTQSGFGMIDLAESAHVQKRIIYQKPGTDVVNATSERDHTNVSSPKVNTFVGKQEPDAASFKRLRAGQA